jgi:cyanophycinase
MNLSLIGGEEFADGFEDVHTHLLGRAGGGTSRGVFLVTAAAEDGPNTVAYWRELAVRRLSATGASVTAPPVVDAASAADPDLVREIEEADWIYLGGGKPHVALGILNGTPVLAAILRQTAAGKLLLGASAGAMMMCQQSFVLTEAALAVYQAALRQLQAGQVAALPVLPCLNLVPGTICAPHFDRSYARQMEIGIRSYGLTVLGIDEQTAMVTDGAAGQWQVLGRGAVTVVTPDGTRSAYRAGSKFTLAGG